MTHLPDFALRGEDSILFPEDCGLINGHITLNGWLSDVVAIRGVYAPPLFSDNFQMNIRFNGRRVPAGRNCWKPDMLSRAGRLPGWRISSRLIPVSGCSAVILYVEAVNLKRESDSLQIQYEITGGLARQAHWGFSKPKNAAFATAKWNGKYFSLNAENDRIAVGSSLKLLPKKPLCCGILDATDVPIVPPHGNICFYTFLTMGVQKETDRIIAKLKANPESVCRRSRTDWQSRVRKLYSIMPRFSSNNTALVKLYDRSLLHLLLNEWNVPEFQLHPYYSTGGINGGCVGCYLWNYGEPYRLWSILSPVSAKEHLKTFLKLDLTSCFAFNPDDGSAFGPCYPVNQEKVIFLAHAYVMQTRDTAFLKEKLNGKMIIQSLVEQALMHDDLSKPAVLVDYGDGNHHLELRGTLRYDGIVPDLNLRRCIGLHLVDELCHLISFDPGVDLVKRAKELKKLIRKKLYDPGTGWFYAIDPSGKKYLRYTIQIFKAVGWKNWALDTNIEEALIGHLLNENEFLGDYGLHSLSKLDPAYDEYDIDNGGPGACVSFTPAIIDRLYQSGRTDATEKLFLRLLWLGESLPYWGDSQRADIREYRRDTPIQNDIQGAAVAQTMIFGMFGIRIQNDFSVAICPHIPTGTETIHLQNVCLAGLKFEVECSRKTGTTVKWNKKIFHVPAGDTIILPVVKGEKR